MYEYQFPRVAVSYSIANLTRQVDKIAEEVGEVRQCTNTSDMMTEIFDVIHACETALHMLEEHQDNGNGDGRVMLDGTHAKVIIKNRKRGYYGTGDKLERLYKALEFFARDSDCPLNSCWGKDREEKKEREAAVEAKLHCPMDCDGNPIECWCEWATLAPDWWW